MRTQFRIPVLLAVAVIFFPGRSAAADPFNEVCEKVNAKMVKVFGAGGFTRLNNFGTGILISPDGHILTVASQLLDTSDLVVHLYDGRRMRAEEKAHRLPVLLSVPLVACMLPVMIGVLMLPAVIRVIRLVLPAIAR